MMSCVMLNMQLKNTVKCFFVFVIIYWKTNRIPRTLFKVATNISKNISRYNNRHAAENLDELREIGIRDNDRDVFELIMKLPVKYRIVLDLYYIEGYKANSIAEITNTSPMTVRKRLQYGRKLLKRELEL